MAKVINLPGGDTASFPDSMSNEAIEKVLREQYKPAQAAPEPVAQAEPGEPVRSTLERVLGGIKGGAADLAAGFSKVGSYIAAPVDLAVDAATGRPLGTGHRERMQSIEDFAAEHGNNDITSAINQGVPEMAAMGGGAKRVLLDVPLNAAWEGAKAAAAGEPVLPAAGRGALGAAGGRVLMRALSGVKPLMSESAKALVERGITPTPGQLFDGPVGKVIARTEDRLAGLPLAGDVVNYSRRRAVGEFNRAAINEAIDPVAQVFGKVSGAGHEAVDAATQKVSAAFNRGLDGIHVTGAHIEDAIKTTEAKLPSIALLDEGQAAQMRGFINQRIRPLIQGDDVTGDIAKAVDSELGHYARKYSRSPNPGDHPMGDAFDALQDSWREAMAKGAQYGGDIELVRAANQAYRNMLPIVKAADKAMAQGGVFTPNQLARSTSQMLKQRTPSYLTQVAQDVLPSRVADSGTAGRLLLGGSVLGGAALPGVPVALMSALAYSRPGINLLIHGLGGAIPPKARARMLAMAPQQAVELMQRVAAKNPEFARQLAAQLGRMQASQSEQASQEDTLPPLSIEEELQ